MENTGLVLVGVDKKLSQVSEKTWITTTLLGAKTCV